MRKLLWILVALTGAFAVGAGSNLCPKPLVQAGHWDEITELARAFVAAVSAARS